MPWTTKSTTENPGSQVLAGNKPAASRNNNRARTVPLLDIKEAVVVADNSRDDRDTKQRNPCVRRDEFHPLKYWGIE